MPDGIRHGVAPQEGAAREERLLVVEDDPHGRDLLHEVLSEEGYAVETCPDAEAALRRLKASGPPVQTVLLDWILPGMSGIDLLRWLKSSPELADVPVILETALTDVTAVQQGIAAGAYYYVSKPLDAELVRTIVRAALDDRARQESLQDRLRQKVEAVGTLERGIFRYRTVAQATALATLLSQTCPDPERTVPGLAELLVNAVEHGNLGISYTDKSRLLADGSWADEVERRLALEENRGKSVEVLFEKSPGRITFTIRDEGPGFDWERYLTISPDRILDNHGRGIAMARIRSFDSIRYEAPGNRVTACVERPPALEDGPASARGRPPS